MKMCGRYSIYEIIELQKRFRLTFLPDSLNPIYNASPTMKLPIITAKKSNKITLAKWGLNRSNLIINVRKESLKEKFQSLFEKNRCLIPANGFFEWKNKNPFYFTADNIFCFAGIFEEKNEDIFFSIITTNANEKVKSVHDRMPLILPKEKETEYLEKSIIPNPIEDLIVYPVSQKVNNPKNQNSEIIKKLPTLNDF
jgi:putative SOS response-associated peptidase YedK